MTSEDIDRLPSPQNRWFDSFQAGELYQLGEFSLTEAEVIQFAQQFDPQPMHTDPTSVDVLIASGWHTIGSSMRLIADNFLSPVVGLPSPRVESIQWKLPVHPQDRIHVEALIESCELAASKPDHGVLSILFTAYNQDDQEVMSFSATCFVLTGPK